MDGFVVSYKCMDVINTYCKSLDFFHLHDRFLRETIEGIYYQSQKNVCTHSCYLFF